MSVALSSVPLHLVPLVCAAGAALLVLAGRVARKIHAGAISLGAALAILAAASVPLFHGDTVISAGPRIARSGSLDASLGLALDVPSAVIAAIVLVGCAVLALSRRAPTAAAEAAIPAAAGALLLGVLGDGFPSLVAGWLGFGLVLAALVGRDAQRAAGRVLTGVLASSIALGLAGALVFWTLGGKFLDGRRYLSDYRARFVAVTEVPGGSAGTDLGHLSPEAKGELSMTTHPGAKVYLGVANEAQITPRLEPFAVSPFLRARVDSGVQKIAIDPGGGSIVGGDGHDIALVDEVRFPPGARVRIDVVGPTVTFSEIAAQLSSDVPHPDASAGPRSAPAAPTPAAFGERKLGPLPMLDAARASIALALLLLGWAVGSGSGSARTRALGALGGAALGAVTCARLAPVLAGPGTLATLVGLAALAFALFSALVAARAAGPGALLARSAGWLAATIACAAVFDVPARAMAVALGPALGLASVAVVLAAVEPATPEPDGGAVYRAKPRPGEDAASIRDRLGIASRPALVGVLAGAAGWGGVLAAAGVTRGGFLGVLVALLALVSAAVVVFAVQRSLVVAAFRLNEPSQEPTAKKKGRGKKKRDGERAIEAVKAAPVTNAPALGGERASAFLAAIALVVVVASYWLARWFDEHAGLALASLIVAAAIETGGLLRARSHAKEPRFDERLAREDETFFARVARGPLERADGDRRNPVRTAALLVERALRFPSLLLGGGSMSAAAGGAADGGEES